MTKPTTDAQRHPDLSHIVEGLRPLAVRAGNGLLEAARRLGWTHVAVIESDDDDATAAAYALADNRTGDLSTWDDAVLLATLDDIQGVDPEMLCDLEFTTREVESLRMSLGEDKPAKAAEAEEVPEPMDDPITKPGDLWILGDHRLLCGNSGNPDDLDVLLDGEDVHLVNMDPPYNVKVEPRSNNPFFAANEKKINMHHQSFDLARHKSKAQATTKKMRAKDRPLENDFVSEADFKVMLLAWFSNASRVLVPGRSFYIWGGYANCANYPQALIDVGFYFSQAIIWTKEHPVLTRKDFMGNHEWCFYGWKEGAGHEFFGPANIADVWQVKKVNPQSMIHLTEKPVDLAVRSIRYSSRRGENVLDLFGGSGSTLMGCEQMKRRGFLMELDPAYCDVIVKRWEKATGEKAQHVPAEAEEPAAADA